MARVNRYSREWIAQQIEDKQFALLASDRSAIRFTIHGTQCRMHMGFADHQTGIYYQVNSGRFWIPLTGGQSEMVEHIHRFMF